MRTVERIWLKALKLLLHRSSFDGDRVPSSSKWSQTSCYQSVAFSDLDSDRRSLKAKRGPKLVFDVPEI